MNQLNTDINTQLSWPAALAKFAAQSKVIIANELEELLVCRYSQEIKSPLIWVLGENESLDERTQKIIAWLSFIGHEMDVVSYMRPVEDPYLNLNPRWEAVLEKNRLYQMRQHPSILVLTTLSALQYPLESRSQAFIDPFMLSTGMEIDRDVLIDRLLGMGYRSATEPRHIGEMAYRGAVVEFFPPAADFPLRVEMEGDTISSLRFFDVQRHKTVRRLSEYEVVVAAFELNSPGDEPKTPLPNWLESARLIWSQKDKLEREFIKLTEQLEQIRQGLTAETNTLPLPWRLDTLPKPDLEIRWDEGDGHIPMPWRRYNWTLNTLDERGLQELQAWLDEAKTLIYYNDSDQARPLPLNGDIHSQIGKIPYSFIDNQSKTLYLAERSFSYIPPPDSQLAAADASTVDFSAGDLVVHKDHGIGRVMGFKRMKIAARETEFLQIAYGGSESLYVPIFDMDVLSRYSALEGAEPTLDRLGGKTWERKKQRAQKSIVTFAKELLELYATRQAIKGHVFGRENEWEDKLAAGFAYVETRDQKRAIADVYTDLERDVPMDRLVCGDVSFGKTEVAIRSAFRVLSHGSQVALLCPTTILAEQHTRTFTKRLSLFGIHIACLTRRTSPKERDNILAGLKLGQVDLLIGTHSLLAKSLVFKRLGLMIIDEEQRFGVFQKEQLKQQWPEIDVLTLSATPLPRTLSLAMAGLQDISVINSPPMGRLAVKNFVGYFSREVLVSAVNREMERDGQVFIVYNRIDTLFSFAERIKPWLEGIEIGVMHAQMSTREIETVLQRFLAGDLRVLISTTIIENGIDIPRVNTLVVINADRLGLTQLYQLRGRIGRSDRQAYACFLVENEVISEKAQKRLDGIREFCDLGAGYQLAAFDLRLRGAGSLLGNRQHGHIEALGFDYYNELLRQAVATLRGVEERQRWLTVKVNFSYGLSPDLIPDEQERLDLYRSIHSARTFAALHQIKLAQMQSLASRVHELSILFYVASAKLLCKQLGGSSIEMDEDCFTIHGHGEWWTGQRLQAVEDLFLLEIMANGAVTIGFTELDQFVDALLEGKIPLPMSSDATLWGEPLRELEVE